MNRLLLALAIAFSAPLCAEDGTILRFYCETAEPRLHLTTNPGTDQAQSFRGSNADLVNVSALISYNEVDGNVHRKGSASVHRKCGRLSVKISGGYFNGNPQGELGAAPDYPLVEIFDGPKQLIGPLAIGTCESSNGRYSFRAECPKNWATEVTVFKGSRDSELVIYMAHAYEEYRHGL